MPFGDAQEVLARPLHFDAVNHGALFHRVVVDERDRANSQVRAAGDLLRDQNSALTRPDQQGRHPGLLLAPVLLGCKPLPQHSTKRPHAREPDECQDEIA